MSKPFVVLCTYPSLERAREAARRLVEDRRAACVNVVPGIRSIYRWENEIHDDEEVLMVIKTSEEAYAALESAIVALHPYDCPEVLALPAGAGFAPYIEWLENSLRGDS